MFVKFLGGSKFGSKFEFFPVVLVVSPFVLVVSLGSFVALTNFQTTLIHFTITITITTTKQFLTRTRLSRLVKYLLN